MKLVDVIPLDMQQYICQEAAKRYSKNESFQLLSPVNRSGNLSVSSLNNALHAAVNPCTDKSEIIDNGNDLMWNGDRILVI